MPRVVATITARMGSSRLPGKVLFEAAGNAMLGHLVERMRRARLIDEIVVATTTDPGDDVIAQRCRDWGVALFRGSGDNVLERVVEAQRAHGAELCALITGDCPVLDPAVVDLCVAGYLAARGTVAYVSNCEVRSYPFGQELQVMSLETLAESLDKADRPAYFEHAGWYLRRHPERYVRLDVIAPPGLCARHLKLALDEPEDVPRMRAIFEHFLPDRPGFTVLDLITFAKSQGWTE